MRSKLGQIKVQTIMTWAWQSAIGLTSVAFITYDNIFIFFTKWLFIFILLQILKFFQLFWILYFTNSWLYFIEYNIIFLLNIINTHKKKRNMAQNIIFEIYFKIKIFVFHQYGWFSLRRAWSNADIFKRRTVFIGTDWLMQAKI